MKNELNFNISNSTNISISDIHQSISVENPIAIEELIDVIVKIENDISIRDDKKKQEQLSELKIDLKKADTGNKIKSFLLSSGKWVLDFAKEAGKDILVDYVKKG